MELSPEERSELHDELFLSAVERVQEPVLDEDGTIDDAARRGLNDAILLLDRVLELQPNDWRAMWGRGRARQFLGEHDHAYEGFRTAYEIAPDSPDLGRDLIRECIELGNAEEAIAVATAASARSPFDAGLIAYLAVGHLINGDLEMAVATLERSLALDSEDIVTQSAKRLIESVRARQT